MQNEERGTLSSWLGERCHHEGLSLRQTADRTGLSHATISDIIKGGRPSADSVRKLALSFGGNGMTGLALEDKLLILAGYRTPRSEGSDLSEPTAQLMDIISDFSDRQLRLLNHFATYLADVEKGQDETRMERHQG